MRWMSLLCLVCLAAALLSGCGGGRVISRSQEIQMGREAADQFQERHRHQRYDDEGEDDAEEHRNTRTQDRVIRREFDMAEGDAYNRVLVDRAERRLKNLGFFKDAGLEVGATISSACNTATASANVTVHRPSRNARKPSGVHPLAPRPETSPPRRPSPSARRRSDPGASYSKVARFGSL